MAVFQGSFLRKLELEAGEQVNLRLPASHSVGRATWVGGYIYVTDRRFFFCPGSFAIRRYGVLRLPLAEISSVDVTEPMGTAREGGKKRRLRVTHGDGDEQLFLTRRVDKRVAKIQACVAQTRQRAGDGQPAAPSET